MIKKIFIIGVLLFSVSFAKAQFVAIKTDFVKDFALMPALGVDAVVGEKHTLGIDGFIGYKPWGLDMKIYGISPNFKYWFSGRPMARQYVGVAAGVTDYFIHWKKDFFDGNSATLGLIFGHIFNLSPHFNIELSSGLNILGFMHKEYYEGDTYGDYGEKNNNYGVMLFPRIEASISYIIK